MHPKIRYPKNKSTEYLSLVVDEIEVFTNIFLKTLPLYIMKSPGRYSCNDSFYCREQHGLSKKSYENSLSKVRYYQHLRNLNIMYCSPFASLRLHYNSRVI